MRGYENLNYEHNQKLREQANSVACIGCGKIFTEESGAETLFVCDECDTIKEA